jgi:hypothetical protein
MESLVAQSTIVREWINLVAYVHLDIVKPAIEKGKLTKEAAARANRTLKPVLEWAKRWKWDPDRRRVADTLVKVIGSDGLLNVQAPRESLVASSELLRQTAQALTLRGQGILERYDGVKARTERKLYRRRGREIASESKIPDLSQEAAQALKSRDILPLLLAVDALQRGLEEVPHHPVPRYIQEMKTAMEEALGPKRLQAKIQKAVAIAKAQSAIAAADEHA